jgi:predicted MFS family arabinose efflux permease
MRSIARSSLDHGLPNPPVRWLMLAAPFTAGVTIYGFYAAQPYLLELYGDSGAYVVAGLAAALVAGTQILGGVLVPRVARVLRHRTTALVLGSTLTSAVLALMGLVSSVWAAVALLAVWGTLFAAMIPIRQTLLNGLIPSSQRATVLSSDNLLASAGGVVAQPALGRAADAWSYGASYLVCAGIELMALPFILLTRHERTTADRTDDLSPVPQVTADSPAEAAA